MNLHAIGAKLRVATAGILATCLTVSPVLAQSAASRSTAPLSQICAIGYISYIDFDARPWTYFPQITIAVDQTGFGNRTGTVRIHTGYGPTPGSGDPQNNVQQRWDMWRAAVQGALFAHAPVRVDSALGCSEPKLEELRIVVCTAEADCLASI